MYVCMYIKRVNLEDKKPIMRTLSDILIQKNLKRDSIFVLDLSILLFTYENLFSIYIYIYIYFFFFFKSKFYLKNL